MIEPSSILRMDSLEQVRVGDQPQDCEAAWPQCALQLQQRADKVIE